MFGLNKDFFVFGITASPLIVLSCYMNIYCCHPPDKIWHKVLLLVEVLGKGEVCKKWAQARLKTLSTKCVYKSYILVYMYQEDMALNIQQWWIFHKTKPNKSNHSAITITLTYVLAI